jgi:hypothetical protein
MNCREGCGGGEYDSAVLLRPRASDYLVGF